MRRGVLLHGRARDPHLRALQRELARRGRPVAILRAGAYPRDQRFSIHFERGRPTVHASDLELETFGVGWMGSPQRLRLDGALTGEARAFARHAARQGLDSFLRGCRFPWINSPDAAHQADDKVHQLRVAAEIGFTIPRTLVTNDPRRFQDFRRRSPRLIVKSLAGNQGLGARRRVLTQRVVAKSPPGLEYAPVIFQENVPKRSELRVTVVGDRVHAARIFSQNSPRTRTDWRRYGPALTYEEARLPAALARRCRALTRRLGLDYGGIDLVETPDGGHVFLEINSLPAWLWLEDATGLQITSSIADLLEDASRRAR